MKRFVDRTDRGHGPLPPECLDDFIDDEKPVRTVDTSDDALDLQNLGFEHSSDPRSEAHGAGPSLLR